MVYDVRLVAYEPGGKALGFLPEPSKLDVSFPHNDTGALTLEYSSLAAGGPLLERGLEEGLEVAAEVTGRDGKWVEPRGGRFLLINRDDDQADAARMGKLTLPSYGWLPGKARNLETANLLPEDADQAGKRPFYSASAGVIMGTLLDENAVRGGVPVGRSWTSQADSAGAAWALVATLYYDLGVDLGTILANLAAQGMCDWRTLGRDLALYNPDTECAPDVSDTVRLWLGTHVADAPSSESLEEVVSRVLLRGEGGLTLVEENPAAPTPWGAWEGYIEQGGVSDEGTMRQLVQSELQRTARVRGQYTRALILAGEPEHLPMVDYGPGSWITAPTTGTGERVRVQQVTITKDADGVSGSVVLNDRVLDRELRQAKRVQGITGGATSGGAGGRPAPEGPDTRQPAAPQGLVVDTDAYIDANGNARGLLDMLWGQVTTATDGTVMEIAGYDVAVRVNVVGAPWSIVLSTDGTDATHSPVDVGADLAVKVRARGRYSSTPGAWSAAVAVTVADDVTPPPVPSAPVLSSRLGTIKVTWDGATASGGTMPRDFDRVDVVEDGTVVGEIRPSTGVSSLVRAFPDVAPHTYTLRAVDRSGNVSADSTSVSITTVRIEGPDIKANSITTNELVVGFMDFQIATGVELESGTITGALIRTAETGDRIELSGNSFKSIQGGDELATIDPAGIRVNAGGSLLVNDGGSFGSRYASGRTNVAVGKVTGTTEQGFFIYGDVDTFPDIFRTYWRGSDSSKQVWIGHEDSPAQFTAYTTGAYIYADDDLWFQGKGDLAAFGTSASNGTAHIEARGSGGVNIISLTTDGDFTRARLRLYNDAAFLAHYTTGGTLRSRVHLDDGEAYLQYTGTSGNSRVLCNADGVALEPDLDEDVWARTLTSVGSGAIPVKWRTDGSLGVDTSSRRFKNDIRDHTIDTAALLSLSVRSWVHDDDLARNPGTTLRDVGFIAEEIDEAGLYEAVVYDPDGTPRTIKDRPLIAGLLQIVQDHAARLAALESVQPQEEA